MLKKLTVHGFKSIERQTIELEPLNVLIGANGSGKSNLIDAVTFFQASALGEREILVKRMGGAGRLLFHGNKTTKACLFSCEAAEFSYEQTLIPVAGNSLDIASERLTIRDSAVEWSAGGTDLEALERQLKEDEERHLGEAVANGELTEDEADAQLSEFPSVRSYIKGWRRYHLYDTSATAAVKSACPVDDNRYLRGDASNLAAYLYWLRKIHPPEYRRIVAMVRLDAPYFEDFVLEPQRLNEKTIRLEWKQRQSDAYFDADSLSDGTLRFIGLATLFNQPKSAMPSLIVIDEPELGLHLADPGPVEEFYGKPGIAQWMRQASETAGGPESINQGKETHPSKRLEGYAIGFRKTAGVAVLKEIGIPAIRTACPHFACWLGRLEAHPIARGACGEGVRQGSVGRDAAAHGCTEQRPVRRAGLCRLRCGPAQPRGAGGAGEGHHQ